MMTLILWTVVLVVPVGFGFALVWDACTTLLWQWRIRRHWKYIDKILKEQGINGVEGLRKEIENEKAANLKRKGALK